MEVKQDCHQKNDQKVSIETCLDRKSVPLKSVQQMRNKDHRRTPMWKSDLHKAA